jgi:selenocysteine-specific elongation factor
LIEAEVGRAGPAGVSLQQLSHLTALSKQAVAGLLRTMAVVVTRSGLVLQQTDMDALLACIPALLARHANGLPPDRLLVEVPRLSPALLEEVVAVLLTRGLISKRGAQLVVPREDADRARSRSETQLASAIAEKLRRGGLTPPTPSEVVKDLPSKRAVDQLLKQGILIRTVDRAKGREILFHQEAIADAQRRLGPLLGGPPGLLVTEIGAALGISRKYSMPLLDHLDAIRFTRRINDRRIRGVR